MNKEITIDYPDNTYVQNRNIRHFKDVIKMPFRGINHRRMWKD